MLTDTKLRNAKARDRHYRISDSQGLCIAIQPSGGKLFQIRYRLLGKERTYSVGSYPSVSLADARSERDRIRKLISLGVDPVAERKNQRSNITAEKESTFELVAQSWLKVWAIGKSERHVGYVQRRLEADVFPAIGSLAIGDVTAPLLVAMLKRIQSRGVTDLAKRCHQMCSQIFRYAVAHGLTARNPAADFRPSDVLSSPKKKNFARIDAKELPELLRAIEGYSGSPVTRIAMHLLALTFVRTSELIQARWNEIDLKNKRWQIPAERMKMNDPHIVPLSAQAIHYLTVLGKVSGSSPLLFPGERRRDKPMSNNTILKALERMGYKGRMTGHGFRGLASTVLHEQGFDHQHIEAQLSHQERNKVSSAYNHAKYLKQRTGMMQAWGNYLDAEMRSLQTSAGP